MLFPHCFCSCVRGRCTDGSWRGNAAIVSLRSDYPSDGLCHRSQFRGLSCRWCKPCFDIRSQPPRSSARVQNHGGRTSLVFVSSCLELLLGLWILTFFDLLPGLVLTFWFSRTTGVLFYCIVLMKTCRQNIETHVHFFQLSANSHPYLAFLVCAKSGVSVISKFWPPWSPSASGTVHSPVFVEGFT